MQTLLKIKRDIHFSNFFTRKVPLEICGSQWRMLKNLITVILTSVAKIQPVIQSMPLIYAQAVDIVMGRFLNFASLNDIVKVDIFHYFQNCFPLLDIQMHQIWFWNYFWIILQLKYFIMITTVSNDVTAFSFLLSS